MARFVPAKSQPALPQDKFIISHKPEGDDVVPFDVVFVGAGPAGLAGAIELARLVKADGSISVEIGVLEKAATLGGHSLSGAVINPIAFRELFPDMKDSDFPFRRPVTEERVFLMTQNKSLRIPTPPTMQNHGYYIASLCEVVRWLGQQAEALGVNIMAGFPVDSLLVDGKRAVGVRTTPAGLKRDGSNDPNGMPATDVAAQVVVLSDGTRSPLAQSYLEWQDIKSHFPQIYALGVKEVWKVKKAPNYIAHTLGWPMPKDAFGGSFMYPLSDDQIALGIVAGLDYRNAKMDVHLLLQHMKQHPLFKEILEGGQCVEWGAKTIPEGGFHALPSRLTGDGLIMTGDAVGLVNVPALKGIHYAMMSGMLAARAIFKALKAGDTSQASLASYDQALKESFVWKDLRKVRNMRLAFKDGFYTGGIKASLMTVTGGAFPGDPSGPEHEDAEEWKDFYAPDFPTEKVGLSKVDAVYMSANKTRDDIPQHLIVGKDISPEMADFYSALCPAGVYERQGDKLVVNAPNCVDCKATDVVGPRWTPREGGSGPDYKQM
ncbi:MAG: 4Fe-4S dicluster domain-containing protein [Bdellovibrionales bacterium]|nr:4Fe-4S dicluster domain-containing protein [Bdellovibrionales bacterium]